MSRAASTLALAFGVFLAAAETVRSGDPQRTRLLRPAIRLTLIRRALEDPGGPDDVVAVSESGDRGVGPSGASQRRGSRRQERDPENRSGRHDIALFGRNHLTMDRGRHEAGSGRGLHACLVTIAAALACQACTGANGEAAPASSHATAQACEDPRPELCAQLYEPVCADRDTGVRCVTTPCDSTERREYPNACDACRDPRVLSYVLGPCAE